MMYHQQGSEHARLTSADLKQGLYESLDLLGPKKRVIAVPPDHTRFHSRAGEITALAFQYYGSSLTDILPALGTHNAMRQEEINNMFPDVPAKRFRVHDWRNDVVTIGTIPGDVVADLTGNAVTFSWPAQLNRLVSNGGHDLILSVGQVVPHEVMGMASYNKNLFIGTGGAEGINKSHFIGAVCGMETLMGKAVNPVRKLLNMASARFTGHLPVVYVHTVIGRDMDGELVTRGLFIGDDEEVFLRAAELSLKVNFTQLEKPLKKVVVYLDPGEYRSTWLGNKSIYRTRMAIADEGMLIVLAPGVREFGEDPEIDRLIRKYGYYGTPEVLQKTTENDDLKNNLSAAAHLIHGSSEGRFDTVYCPGHLSRQEVEKAGFSFAPLEDMMARYDPDRLSEGYNITHDGEEVYFISNPAIGLWTAKK